jgi:hypothetical protein
MNDKMFFFCVLIARFYQLHDFSGHLGRRLHLRRDVERLSLLSRSSGRFRSARQNIQSSRNANRRGNLTNRGIKPTFIELGLYFEIGFQRKKSILNSDLTRRFVILLFSSFLFESIFLQYPESISKKGGSGNDNWSRKKSEWKDHALFFFFVLIFLFVATKTTFDSFL